MSLVVPILRYWCARGRCQPLRLQLADTLGLPTVRVINKDNCNEPHIMHHWLTPQLHSEDVKNLPESINWIDEQVSFDVPWKTELKAQRSFSGDWETFPLLTWTNVKGKDAAASSFFDMNQTEAIARHLARRFGTHAATEQEEAAADSLICGVYQSMTTETMKVLYSVEVEKEWETQQKAFRVVLPKVQSILELALQRQKEFHDSSTGVWSSGFARSKGGSPMPCDYFALDALNQVHAILGHSLLEDYPLLCEFRSKMSERPNIRAYLEQEDKLIPTKWCWSPNEEINWIELRGLNT